LKSLRLAVELQKGQNNSVRKIFLFAWILLPLAILEAKPPSAPGYEIMKVNHEFIDLAGETQAEIANWVDRAKYQQAVKKVAHKGVRFFVHWQVPSTLMRDLTIKIETQGWDSDGGRETQETLVRTYPKIPNYSGWAVLDLEGDRYRDFGRMMAWKVTILHQGEVMATRESFMWNHAFLEKN
jgi:hypothetical protein